VLQDLLLLQHNDHGPTSRRLLLLALLLLLGVQVRAVGGTTGAWLFVWPYSIMPCCALLLLQLTPGHQCL
jgi:hypothetical protein